MQNHPLTDLVATFCLGLGILHTFSVKWFQGLASRFKDGSVGENVFHLLGEVEVVFGLWAGVFILFLTIHSGSSEVSHYLNSLNFTEPAFVFVIMSVCSTKPILQIASGLIGAFSKIIPTSKPMAFYVAALIVGPLLGSFITEPAAMTVTALILLERFYSKKMSSAFRYATLGLLFVNVSIGGTLTPYAAPPVLMVASKWNWDLAFMLEHFGWKGALAVTISTLLVALTFRRELSQFSWEASTSRVKRNPVWIQGVHLFFLILIVLNAHSTVIFSGLFLFFIGLFTVTKEYQQDFKLREGLLVGFFLAGLVVLGGPQRWWLEPVLSNLATLPLYLGSIGLTAITDNAALTYLGSQVPGLSDASRYALVAGAVVGGGLTVIANAPNPAGYGILNQSFGREGINPLSLFKSALVPTLIAAMAFWFL